MVPGDVSKGPRGIPAKKIFKLCRHLIIARDATFGTKAAVKSHVKGKHLGMKYKCPACPKEFVQNGALKTHLEGIHYGIRYPCKFCDYTSYDPSALNKHMKRIHNQPLARRLEKFAKNVEKNNIKSHLFKVWKGPPISC